MGKSQMVEELRAAGILGSPLVKQALESIDRADFVPAEATAQAYHNEPLPIGYGQTISQPSTVAFMLDLLEPGPGMKILDIGTGSGWQAALLAYIVSHDLKGKELPANHQGKVIGMELIPELAQGAVHNIGKYSFIRKKVVTVHCLNAVRGYEEEAPYDRIIAAATGSQIPAEWKDQLKVGGRLVAPVGGQVVLLIKQPSGDFTEKVFDNFSFVPFINN